MKAVIFDCDGVLINSEELSLGVELECLAEIDLPFEPHDYVNRFMGMTTPEYYAELQKDFQAKHGRAIPEAFYGTLDSRLLAVVDAELALIEGAHLVRELSLPKAVASGSNPNGLAAKLKKVGLYDAFAPHVYSAHLVTRGKPAPDIYLHAAKQLGVDPKDCVAVEDSANGVTAARTAGMLVIGFTGGAHCPPQHGERLRGAGAAHLATHMNQVLAILRGLS
jgi:HAD superfamily hydrolase (TIGR01509 family)